MKKIIRYMQQTALEYSDPTYSGRLYLNAGEKEPQQRVNHRQQHQKHQDYQLDHERTLVNPPRHNRHLKPPPPMTRTQSDRPPPIRLPSSISSAITRTQYSSEHILQSYEVYTPPHPPSPGNTTSISTPPASGTHTPVPKYWIIYIHGGYFRDPTVQSASFHPALAKLTSTDPETPSNIKSIQPHIAGYASINYRLAAHPAYEQDAEKTSSYELRNATWPEMMDDILTALRHLQRKYHFGERYLLVGHSVGATMALLTTLRASSSSITPPLAVAGVCGIYDFPRLHERYPDYIHMTKNAIRHEADFLTASPAEYARQEFDAKWAPSPDRADGTKKSWLTLAQSRSDGLVDWAQAEAMHDVFEAPSSHSGTDAASGPGQTQEIRARDDRIVCDLMEVQGRHNEVWERGEELARVCAVGVGEMMGLDQ